MTELSCQFEAIAEGSQKVDVPLKHLTASPTDAGSHNSFFVVSLCKVQGDKNPHLTHSTHTKRVAFTLAEVLITLAIIGIVAAMTIPTLIANYQEKVTVTRLKKAYSVLSQAFTLAISEYGAPKYWASYSYETDSDETVTRLLAINIVKQLKVAKDCGYASDGCFPESAYQFLASGNERDFENNEHYYKLILPDGFLVAIQGYPTINSSIFGEIWVDINGKAAPNTVGKDLFLFNFSSNSVLPYGYDKMDKELSTTSCSTTSGTGYDCTAWVIHNENLDYLHCNDLSWTGKHKCDE